MVFVMLTKRHKPVLIVSFFSRLIVYRLRCSCEGLTAHDEVL